MGPKKTDIADEDTTVARGAQPVAASGESQPFLLVVSGMSLGKSVRIDKRSCLIGRGQDADLILDDDGISRHHAKVVTLANGVLMVKDLDSTNGTYVNGERIQAHPIEDGDRIRLGASTTVKFVREDAIDAGLRQQLYEAATRDPLTGAFNKRFFGDQLLKSVAFSKRHKQPLSIILLDIDHFKSINDTHGHVVGDDVLRSVAQVVSNAVRAEDSFSRIGGEEFCVMVPGIDLDNAALAAERLRQIVESTQVDIGGTQLSVTMSFGVATLDFQNDQTGDGLVGEADRRLYEAKHAGRNCVRPVPPKGP